MLAAPITTGCAHAALHFIENEKEFVVVANCSQRLQPFAAEMIVAALALDRLNDDGADVDLALVDKIANLPLRVRFAPNYIGFALRFRQRKINARAGNA